MARFISTQTTLEPYGLVRISGEVAKNPDFDGYQQEPHEQPFYVRDLKVVTASGEVLQGHDENAVSGRDGQPAYVTICGLEPFEIEKCEEVLIEKFTDEEASTLDYLIDEAIERGREYARNAYA